MGEVVQVEDLFNKSWFPEKGNGFLDSVFLILYTPIGLLLFLLRIFIALQFLLLIVLLPQSKLKQKASRVMSAVLGVTYSTDGEILSGVFVANHVTRLDHFVIHLFTNALTPVKSGLPNWLIKPLAVKEPLEKEEILSSSTPVLLFPERESTNGAVSLLQFERLECLEISPAPVVQPIALKVSRILLNVNSVQSGLCSEIFFTFFLPNTHFVVKCLPPEPWNPSRTQETIARALDLTPSKLGVGDKAEYIKKLNFRPPSLASQARAVQQQLSPVILSPETIIASLQRTGSVSQTVEELRKSLVEPSFRKSASERMTSFQERKRVMVLTARKKYMEKHGMEPTPSSTS